MRKKPKLPRRKREKKLTRLESLMESVRSYKQPDTSVDTGVISNKEKDAAHKRFVHFISTDENCFRPDIYLNSDKRCDSCYLVDYCNCDLKKLSKKS